MIDVTYLCEVVPQAGDSMDDDDVATIIDVATDELIRLGFEDTTLAGSLAARTLEIALCIHPEGYRDEFGWLDMSRLVAAVDSAVRAAFHAAGVSTPGWPPASDGPRLARRSVSVNERTVDLAGA
jgi:hypothetical protein